MRLDGAQRSQQRAFQSLVFRGRSPLNYMRRIESVTVKRNPVISESKLLLKVALPLPMMPLGMKKSSLNNRTLEVLCSLQNRSLFLSLSCRLIVKSLKFIICKMIHVAAPSSSIRSTYRCRSGFCDDAFLNLNLIGCTFSLHSTAVASRLVRSCYFLANVAKCRLH